MPRPVDPIETGSRAVAARGLGRVRWGSLGGGEVGMTVNGASVRGCKNVLQLDWGGGCTTLSIFDILKAYNCTL